MHFNILSGYEHKIITLLSASVKSRKLSFEASMQALCCLLVWSALAFGLLSHHRLTQMKEH